MRDESRNLKEEADRVRKESEAIVEGAKQRINFMLTNPEAMLDIYEQYAPDVLHKAFETYATRLQNDHKLYESDPTAYNALVASRKQHLETKRSREELDRRARELEQKHKQLEEEERARSYNKVVVLLNEHVPKALEQNNLTIKKAPKRIQLALENEFRRYMHNNYDNSTGVTKDFIYRCAAEFAKDPEIKEVIDLYNKDATDKPTDKSTGKEKINKINPVSRKTKGKIIDPNVFFRNIA
jgi:transcriptional regulator of acetoin/glycerol metabolism